MSAFPPIRTQKGIPIPPSTALLYLSAYLSSAKTSPHLLPNARLEAFGATTGSSNSSVTIHNLQRVEAGLNGEWLAPKLDLEEQEKVVEGTTNEDKGEESEGWIDLDQYQREQSVEGPEQAQDDLGVEDEGDVEETMSGDDKNADGDVEMEEQVMEPKTVSIKPPKKASDGVRDKKIKKAVDTAARKKEKKERHKAEKRAKEEQRKQQAQQAA